MANEKDAAEPKAAPAPVAENPFASLKPGRIVNFIPEPRHGADGMAQGTPEPYAAIITRVEDPAKGLISLTAFPPGDNPIPLLSVGYDPAGKPGWWKWMYPGQGSK